MKKMFGAALCALMMGSFAHSTSALAYGAIAVDDQQGDEEPGYGFVTGEDTQDAAKAKAMRECRKQGNDHCKVAVWFKSCGAYAASKKYYGYGFGDSKAIATKKALEMCGNKNCNVAIAECE